MSFASTHWSVVRAAGGDDSHAAREAFATLFETYTPPLLAYVRRHGYDAEDARDLMQAFFAALIERQDLRALKRGGRTRAVPLDARTPEAHAIHGSAVDARDTPEQAFDRQWALTVIEHALARVRRQWREAGKLAEYERLKTFLIADAGGGYRTVARDLGTTGAAARVAVHRLRRRFRSALRDEIAETVTGPSEIDAEIAYLKRALASRAM